MVGVFCDFRNCGVNGNPLLTELERGFNRRGQRVLFSNVPDAASFRDMEFWKSFWMDGAIFAYSSFDPEFAAALKAAGIPFMAANRLPEEYGVAWADYDTAGVFAGIVDSLLRRGIRRIAIDFPVHLSTYEPYIREEWQRLTVEHGIMCGDYMRIEYCADREMAGVMAREHAMHLSSLPEAPEAVIAWHTHPEMVSEIFAAHGQRPDIFTGGAAQNSMDKRIFSFRSPAEKLAEAICVMFEEILQKASATVGGRLIPYDMEILKYTEGNG